MIDYRLIIDQVKGGNIIGFITIKYISFVIN